MQRINPSAFITIPFRVRQASPSTSAIE
jgi:hypothetical protein